MHVLNIEHTLITVFLFFLLWKKLTVASTLSLLFSQNLAFRPKDEVQSAHISGKHFTLHGWIVDHVGFRYHFHLSDDTIHNPVLVDHVLRDIIIKYYTTEAVVRRCK